MSNLLPLCLKRVYIAFSLVYEAVTVATHHLFQALSVYLPRLQNGLPSQRKFMITYKKHD